MILGIDLGKSTTGIATSQGAFASPYKTLTHKSQKEALEKISALIKEEGAETIVIGFVEGKIKIFFENFAKNLKEKNPNVEIILWDETLTSRQAREYMVKQNVPKLKRATKEHEVAAALILQSYLDADNTSLL
ncbi:MAG: Holliday junction resolvase RuvX [Candidatus Curtissbacteria bacterium]|nr:Holliday junction resolvase RuvX [Candidatus Curtissbacteria bacterium]